MARRTTSWLTTLLAFSALSMGTANADAFNDGINDAYASFRTADSYLRTGNAGLASLDLAHASETWNAIAKAAKSNPPQAYARDTEFAATLDAISQSFINGLSRAESGDAQAAIKAIRPVRQLLYDMRVRNGQRVYADCITELNAAMDKMWIYRRDPPDFSVNAVREHTATIQAEYAAILKDCVGMASDADRKNTEFSRLTENTEISNTKLGEAIAAGDPVAYINYLRELRSLDRIIFFRFGS